MALLWWILLKFYLKDNDQFGGTFGWLCSSILRICTTSPYFCSLIWSERDIEEGSLAWPDATQVRPGHARLRVVSQGRPTSAVCLDCVTRLREGQQDWGYDVAYKVLYCPSHSFKKEVFKIYFCSMQHALSFDQCLISVNLHNTNYLYDQLETNST